MCEFEPECEFEQQDRLEQFEQLEQQLRDIVDAVSNAEEAYSKLYDQLLSFYEPFSWNRTEPSVSPNLREQNYWRDIQQYEQLIHVCLVIGNTTILDKWGMPYEQADKEKATVAVLAEDREVYRRYFEARKNDKNWLNQVFGEHIEARNTYINFLQYLIERLSNDFTDSDDRDSED